MDPMKQALKKDIGQRSGDKNPEQSRIARSNAAKAVQDRKRKEREAEEKKNANISGGAVPGGPGVRVAPSSPIGGKPGGAAVDPSRPGGRVGRFLGDDPRETVKDPLTDEQKGRLKQNLTDFKNALPLYLQGYADFLNEKVDELLINKPTSKWRVNHPKLPDAEAKSDAALLATLVERYFFVVIEKYPALLGIFLFLKHTFFRAKIKKVDPDTMKSVLTVVPDATKAETEKTV